VGDGFDLGGIAARPDTGVSRFRDRAGAAAAIRLPPPLTSARKAKILGLNGARVYGVEPKLFRNKAENDGIERLRADYRNAPRPDFESHGPRSRAEFGAFLKHSGNRSG